jgi:TolA-binding protein
MKSGPVSLCFLTLLVLASGIPASVRPSAEEQLSLAMDHLGSSRYAEALKVARELLASSKDPRILSEAEAIIVLSFLSQGDFEGARGEAQALLAKVRAKRPQSEEVAGLEGLLKQVSEKEAQYRKAIERCEVLILIHRGSEQAAQAEFEIGDTEFAFGRVEAAVQAYRKAMDDYPASIYGRRAMLRVAFVYEVTGRPDKAQAAYAELVARAPDSKEAATAVDKVELAYLRVQDYSGAAARLEEFASGYRGTRSGLTAQCRLGELYKRQGALDKAEATYRDAIDAAPTSPLAVQAALALGEIYINRKQYKLGAERLKDIMRAYPASEVAACAGYLVGRLYELARDFRRADEFYETVIARYPRSRWALEVEMAPKSR